MAIPRQRIRLPQGAWRTAVTSLLRGNVWDGRSLAELEAAIAKYMSVADAVTVPSGRAGFRFLLDALGIESGGEVICSAFGYPVVPFIVKSMGFRLKFVDCEMETLGMDPARLAEACSDSTEAIIATHLYGVPCRIREIAEIAAANRARLIEDCAHCFGATVESKKVGAYGDAGCFSFETSKVINTMGGGIVTLSDPGVAGKIRALAAEEPRNGIKWLARRLFRTSFEAAVTHPVLFNCGVYQALRLASSGGSEEDRFASGYQGDEVSLKGKMGRYANYQAQLALRQLETIDIRNRRRTENAEQLIARLDGEIPLQKPLRTDAENYSNYMLVTVRAKSLSGLGRALLKRGVDSKHLYMRDCSRMFSGGQSYPNAATAEREVLHLPAYPEMSSSQVDRVADAVIESMAEIDG